MDRLRGLATFAAGPLAADRPRLKVRRAGRRPNRLGFAVPAEFRLSVTAYPGIRRGDVLETLLHELTHLHVGRAAEAHAWHGADLQAGAGGAMAEAYGVVAVNRRGQPCTAPTGARRSRRRPASGIERAGPAPASVPADRPGARAGRMRRADLLARGPRAARSVRMTNPEADSRAASPAARL